MGPTACNGVSQVDRGRILAVSSTPSKDGTRLTQAVLVANVLGSEGTTFRTSLCPFFFLGFQPYSRMGHSSLAEYHGMSYDSR